MEFSETKGNLLEQIYSQEIQRNEESLKHWSSYRDAHEKVAKALPVIVKEVSVDCLVPLGKKALLRSKLQHTNEILASIGDGYFVKYSNEQSIDLCKRRIKYAETMLEKFEKERNLIETRQMLPAEFGAFGFGECQDIIENWNESDLENWRVQHRERERQYHKKQSKREDSSTNEAGPTEDEIFRRLDELELEEELMESGLGVEVIETNKQDSSKINLQSVPSLIEVVREDKRVENTAIEKNLIENEREESTCSEQQSLEREDTREERKIDDTANHSRVVEKESNAQQSRVTKSVSFGSVSDDSSSNRGSFRENSDTKKVTFKEPLSTHVELQQQNSNTLGNSDTVDSDDILKIEFVHSKALPSECSSKTTGIMAPHDLYQIFQTPKSILKPSKVQQSMSLDDIQEEAADLSGDDQGGASTYQVVVHDVKERNTEMSAGIDRLTNKKKPSRFKLERATLKR